MSALEHAPVSVASFTYSIPQTGQPNSTEDPKVATALSTLLTWGNGGIDGINLSALLAQSAGVNQSGQTVKGAVNIAASESTSSTTYTTLTTPDRVTGIVLPTNGLIAVWYQATWQESVNTAASAAIFIGGNQLKIASTNSTTPSVQQAGVGAGAGNIASPLATNAGGLYSNGGGGGSYTGDVTTGQIVGINQSPGGPCYIFAAAGVYTVAVMFKSSSGSVTASNRKLWVQALNFA